jgi:hypothetical protein
MLGDERCAACRSPLQIVGEHAKVSSSAAVGTVPFRRDAGYPPAASHTVEYIRGYGNLHPSDRKLLAVVPQVDVPGVTDIRRAAPEIRARKVGAGEREPHMPSMVLRAETGDHTTAESPDRMQARARGFAVRSVAPEAIAAELHGSPSRRMKPDGELLAGE